MDLPNYALVLGIDEMKERRALNICRQTRELFDAIKVEIDDSYIPKIKRETDLPIIADAKLATNAVHEGSKYVGTTSKRVQKLEKKGADYIIIHLYLGPLMVEEAMDSAQKSGVKLLGLPRMTHKTSSLTFAHPLNIRHVERELKEYGYNDLIERAYRCKTFEDFFIEEVDYFKLHGFMYPAFEKDKLIRLRARFPTKEIGTMGLGPKQWPEKEVPLKEQIKQVFTYAGRRSFAVLASTIYQHPDYLMKAKHARDWTNETISELDNLQNTAFF